MKKSFPVSQYLTAADAQAAREAYEAKKTKTRTRSKNDKAYLFEYYWHMLAPAEYVPEKEYNFDAVIGRKHCFDCAFPQYRIGVEVDGGTHLKNGGRHNSEEDMEKRNIAASLRWLVFHFTPEMVKRNPVGCVNMVLKAIQDSI